MKKQFMTVAACLVMGFAMITATATAAQKYRLTLTGASPGGLWSLLGAGIDSAVRAEYPGSTITYQTSGGGLANVALVSAGSAELGIIHNIELNAASQGTTPFKKPIKNLRAVAYMYNWAPMQLVLNKKFAEKYGIKSLADLVRIKPPVRITTNVRGNMVQEINKEIFKAYGVSYDDIKSWGGQMIFAGSKDQGNFFSDRRVDMISNSVFAPHKSIIKVARSTDVIMLPLSEDAIQKVTDKTGADAYTINQSAYPWLHQDVRTVALGAELVVKDSMNEQDVYNLTKALVKNIDKIRAVHTSMKQLTAELMASQTAIPYHAGALRYYKEVGLIK